MKKFILFLFAIVFTASAFGQKSVLTEGNGINKPVFKRTQNVNTNQTPKVSEYYVLQTGTTQETEAEVLADANWLATHAPYSSNGSSNSGVRGTMADIIPTTGATETFTPAVGDHFFDPGGPGGGTTGGTAGNYPNCGCDTVTTLDGVTEVDFLYFDVFANWDYLIIYDSADTSGTVLYNNGAGGTNEGDVTLTDMIASHGSSTFTGTSGSLTFAFHASSVVDRGGWDAEIIAIAGGGGGGNACEETNPSNAFEDGLSSAHLANDVTVSADEDFSLEQITTNWFSFGPAASVDVYYYADAGGFPGTQIGSQLGIVPTSQDIIGSNFGIDVREVVLDVTPFMFNGQTGVATTYWIEVLGAGAYWEMTSASSNGYPKAYSSDGVVWSYWDPTLDGVYTFSGECTPYIEVVPVTDPGLYALYPWSSTNNIALYDYDPVTDVIALDTGFTGSTGVGRNFGFDFNIQDNRVYFIGSDAGWPFTPRNLYSLDIGANTPTLIDQMISVGGNEKPQDLTFGGDGTLYVLFQGGEINSYDIGTNVMSAFAMVPPDGEVGLTYDFDNDRLIHAGGWVPVNIYAIDIATAAVSFLFQFDTPVRNATAQAIEYVGNNKVISSTTASGNMIYTLDLATQSTQMLLDPTGSFDNIKDLMYKGNAPVISCPMDIIADSDPDVCGAVVNFADASAIDLEDGPVATTQTIGPASGSVFPIGVTIIEFSATDSFGYTSTCQFTITVNDVEAPMAMCQDITVELDAAGMAVITPADVDAGSTDNCTGITMALDMTNFDCSHVGENTVELTVTDASGGTDTCTAIVTVEDNQAPEIICHGGGGDSTLTTSYAGGTTGPNGMMFDVMAISTLTVNSFDINLDATGVTVDVYAKTGTWVGSENNSAAWTLIGSVSGMTGTSGTPTPLNLSLGYAIPAGELHAFYVVPQTGNSSYTPGTAVGNLLATDGNIEIYEGCAKRLPIDGGPLWQPRNFNGSIIYGMSTLPPYEVVLDPDGMATVDAGDLLLSVDDNCGTIATFGSGAGAPGTLTTTFAGGNGFFGNMFDIMALNNLTVDSFDVHLAAGTSDDVEVYFKTGTYVGSESNPADWTLLDTAPGITSAGDGVPTPLNLSLGQAVAAGETVAFYVTIVNAGTMSYTNGTTTGALFASDDNMEFYEGAGGGYFDVSFSPRVFNGNILYSTGGGTTMDFDCADLGENMVDITVTDAGGNEAMCTATVLVLDETAPVLICEDKDIELGPDGTTTIDPYDLMANLPSTYEVMVIGSDNASGTEGFTDFTVTITDAASLSFDWDYTLNDIPGYDSFGYLLNGVYTELTDPLVGNQSGTGALAVVPGDEFGFRSYTTDNSFGNNETLITNFMPGFSGQFAPANWMLTLLNSDGNAYITEIPGGIQAYDACGIEIILADVTEVSCADIGTPILVSVFANDASGNFTSCQATINVVDNLEPELVCPDPAMYGTEPSNNDGVYQVRDYLDIGAVTYSDNCTETGSLIYTQTPAPGTEWGINGTGNPGPYEVVFTVEDEYGNIATCILEVTVTNGIGVDENTLLAYALALYPNPASDQVTLVNTSDIALQTAMIYDLNGKLVADIDLSNMQNETSFDVSDFASGVYMVKIVGENANTVKRLVKK